MLKYGIDVSEWQNDIDWSAIQTDFAIIRAGYGRVASQKDKKFEANYAGCKANGIPCGAYWYSYAVTPEEAVLEANACIEILKGKKFEYPIYFDVEQQEQFILGREAVSAIIYAFMSTLEKAGYWVGLYMSAYYLKNYVDEVIPKRYALWVAHHGVDSPDYSGTYGMWQYSSEGRVSGISGNVDLDIGYIDYPTLIKQAGLNGYTVHPPKYVELTIDGVTYAGTLYPKE